MSSDIKPNIEKILVEAAKEQGVFDVIIDNSTTIGKGQGFLSDTGVVNLEGRSKNGKKCKISFVIKTAATNEILRESSAVAEIFKREIYMYEHIFPAFYSFEKERNIENPFSSAPKYYGAFNDVKPEILILENLKQSGYQSWDGKLQMKHHYVNVVLTEYGRFHAISFGMRDQNPKLFQQLTTNLDNVLVTFLKRSGFFNTFINKTKRVLTLLDPHEDAKIYKKYQEFLYGIEEKFESLISACDNFYAILHGDCWSNNMLFKYEDCNKTHPSGIRLIDFQLAKLGSPVFDLLYFFYICTTKEVLKDVDKYKSIYYNSFSEHLRALGSNAEILYPFSIFDGHWKEYAIYGLILSSLLNHSLLLQEDEVSDFTQIVENGGNISEAFDGDIVNIDEYKKRMKNVIEHFVENNFI